MYQSNHVASGLATKNKPLSFKVGFDKDNDNQVFGKCKTIFLSEAYRNHLSLNLELTETLLNEMELDCERLAVCTMRNNQNINHSVRTEDPFYEEVGNQILNDEEDSNGFTAKGLSKTFYGVPDEDKSENGITTKQKKLLINLAEKKYFNNEPMLSRYLSDLCSLTKNQASKKIAELIHS